MEVASAAEEAKQNIEKASAVANWYVKDSFRWVVTRWVPLKEAYIDLI